MKNFPSLSFGMILSIVCFCRADIVNAQTYYSKPSGDLHNTATWGINPDGSGTNPPDFGFGSGRMFTLSNRGGNYIMTSNWSVLGYLIINAGSILYIGNNSLEVGVISGQGALGGTRMSNFSTVANEQPFRFAPGANDLNNLYLYFNGRQSGSTRLASALNVYGEITLFGVNFNAGDSLTLKSTASGTARLKLIPPQVGG